MAFTFSGGKGIEEVLEEYIDIADFVRTFVFNLEHDLEMGGFMKAVCNNSLTEAYAFADYRHKNCIGRIAEFMLDYGRKEVQIYGNPNDYRGIRRLA